MYDNYNSLTSPRGGSRGCLCRDNTYNVKCCDGSIPAQGIGNITGIRRTETFYLLSNKNIELTTQNGNNLVYGK
jgi:hypothetical protein